MSVTAIDTTTQVLVHENVLLAIEDYEAVIKGRIARIKKAEVRWFFEHGEWQLSSVHVWGPIVRKSDGGESTQHVSELTDPPGKGQAPYGGAVTPPEILEFALANAPDWKPELTPSPYPPVKGLRSSL